MNTGSPPVPSRENSHIISEWCVFSAQKGNYGRRERERRNQEEFSSSREQKLQAKRALSQSEVPAQHRAKPARVLQQTAHPRCPASLTQASPSIHSLSPHPPAVSPSTGHRGSPSPPADTPNFSCTSCRGNPSWCHSQGGSAFPRACSQPPGAHFLQPRPPEERALKC